MVRPFLDPGGKMGGQASIMRDGCAKWEIKTSVFLKGTALSKN
jgi:hypothetical protein